MDGRPRTLARFGTPAQQGRRDLALEPALRERLAALWDGRVSGLTEQAILGDPWGHEHAGPATHYVNPRRTALPGRAAVTAIRWPAFPSRLGRHGAGEDRALGPDHLDQLADLGYFVDERGLRRGARAAGVRPLQPGVAPARAHQEEYCEWTVARDPATGSITRVDFTCELPEYFQALWRVSPHAVLLAYRRTLGDRTIALADLAQRDPATGEPMVDPASGRPAYDPLNRWNVGPVRGARGGGAVHLVHPGSTLASLLGLCAAATVQRAVSDDDADRLLAASPRGPAARASDPHVHRAIHELVGAGHVVTLADPVGLYLTPPDFARFELPPGAPAGASPADCFRVERGLAGLPGPGSGGRGSPPAGPLILHAVFEVPPGLGFTVGDLRVDGEPIRFAGQIARTFEVGLYLASLPATPPPELAPARRRSTPLPRALRLLHAPLALGCRPRRPTPATSRCSDDDAIRCALAATAPPVLGPGSVGTRLVLVASGVRIGREGQLPSVVVDGPDDIQVRVLSAHPEDLYGAEGGAGAAAAGSATRYALALEVDVAEAARQGSRRVQIANWGEVPGPALPAALEVDPTARRTPAMGRRAQGRCAAGGPAGEGGDADTGQGPAAAWSQGMGGR